MHQWKAGWHRAVLALAFVAIIGTVASAASALAAGLTVSPLTIAFGNVVFGVTGATSTAHTVTISDPAAGPPISSLSIQLTGTNPGDFQISNNTCGATLAPGTKCILKVTFTPTTLGARGANLAISDSANSNAAAVTLGGTGVAGKLTITPLTLSFGNTVVGATSVAKTTSLRNPNTVALHIDSVSPSGAFSIASDGCSGSDLAPAATCAIKTMFSPTQTGTQNGNLTFTDDAADSPQSEALTGIGILANLTFSPLSLGFGRVHVGSVSATKSVTIGNPNILPLHITSIGAATPFEVVANTCGSSIAAGGNCQVSVTFNPTTDSNPAGTTQIGQLIVTDNGKPVSQSVPLSGIAFGAVPTATATATSTATATATVTATATDTATATATATDTPTPTATATATPTATATAASTATATRTSTQTPTATPSPGLTPVIFVTDDYSSFNISRVTAYPLGSTGNVPTLIPIGFAGPSSIAKDASGRIYVANGEGGTTEAGSIAIYPAGSTGQVLPIAEISGVNTGLSNPNGIALDSAGNIYVTNLSGGPSSNGSITEYAAGSNGDVAPIATITATDYAVSDPQGIALDTAGNSYVANFTGNNGSISVFAPGSNGNATPIASITGSNTGLNGPNGVTLDSSGNIYVSNRGDSITVYPAGSDGNVAPIATIAGSNTLLDYPQALALDSAGNIYAANSVGDINGVIYASGTITVYPPASTGNVSPSAVIYGSNTQLTDPVGLLIDSSIYVANFADPNNELTLYSPGANGNVPPTANLSNPATGMYGPVGIAIDANRKTYVANSFFSMGKPSGSVTIYPSGGYGVAGQPSATIIGANTGLDSPTGIALDTNGKIYVSNQSGGSTGNGSVTVYAAGSNGNATPTATIVAANTFFGILFDPAGIAVDTNGNIYVLASSTSGNCVDVFAPGSNGTVTPSSVIVGAQTQLSQPSGITLDSNGNIYVANKSTPASITMYAAGSSGNVAPTSVISGSNTELNSPVGVAVDSSGNIYVANSYSTTSGSTGTVTVYAAGSSGNVTPIQTISGGDTGLRTPMGIALGFISQ